MRVELLYCPGPGQVDRSELDLPAGATLHDALQASGVLQRHALRLPDVVAGVWSRVKPHDTVLRDGDRVEVYRPLTVDPKEARRLRYRRQGKPPREAARRRAEGAGVAEVAAGAAGAAVAVNGLGSVNGNRR